MQTVKRGRGGSWLLGLGAGTLALAGSAAPAAAVELGADDEIRYVRRDLVLPRMTVSAWGDLRLLHLEGAAGGGTVYSQNIGARIVPLENLEVYANPFSFYAGDASGYGPVGLGAKYRFVDSEVFEMGAELSIPMGQTGPLDFIGMQGGFPMRIHGGDVFRLDTGVFVAGLFDTSLTGQALFGLMRVDNAPVPDVDPMIPIEASIQIVDEFFVGMDMGFGILDVDRAGDSVFVPMGFRIGGTVAVDNRPFVDLGAGFRWPFFINSFGGDAVEPGFFEVQLIRADMHFDLGGG